MKSLNHKLASAWTKVGPGMLPFADAASKNLPLAQLLRLSLFQVSVGMAAVLLTGTLNRVMIVELGLAAWMVSLFVALPLVLAPLRALIGYRSDVYRSALGWRRVPFIWIGTLMQFGGLAILPFSLIIMSGDTTGSPVVGQVGAALAFLLIGAGMHTAQTAGLALATDLAPEETRPRVVALLFVTLLIGMFISALVLGWLLRDFSQLRLIKVIQGAAMVTLALNLVALWKQEKLDPEGHEAAEPGPGFRVAWKTISSDPRALRLLLAVALGTAGFTMQDVLLEPFGGQILGMSVSSTTVLTAILVAGNLLAFGFAARWLSAGVDAHRLAGYGALVGVFAFGLLSVVAGLESVTALRAAALFIGFGSGLFSVGTLSSAMKLAERTGAGMALGAWGAVQATAMGLAIFSGGAMRDIVSGLASSGFLGSVLSGPSVGYVFVYGLEIVLLFVTIIVVGPLVRPTPKDMSVTKSGFGLAEFPG